jgi:CheY-like chemotaxis protein
VVCNTTKSATDDRPRARPITEELAINVGTRNQRSCPSPHPGSVLGEPKLISRARPRHLDAVPADVMGAVVLVVEDERAWQVILETDLLMLGYRPLLAADGIEALEQSVEHDPDVAIVDLMLPGSDGWRLLAELRGRGTSVPTIFYSAYLMGRAENQHPDVVACISKGADRADLYALLPAAIRRNKRRELLRRPGSAPSASPP